MNSIKKIQLIAEILDRYDDGVCLYCGSVLNGDLEVDDFDDSFPDDWCPNCSKSIDPDDNWEDACLDAIDKVIHDVKFTP